MNILATLRERFRPALLSLVDSVDDLLDLIRPAQDPRFGDYQANLAMPLGKRLQQPPREVAQQLVARLQLEDLCEPPEVAGPGFINLRLRNRWLAEQVQRAARDARLGIPRVASPRTFVVDYSSPNVAKAMHVGHIRSTVIGDAIYRTLQFLGHRVISDNHLGDWGTQFGMIIYGYKHLVDMDRYRAHPVQELGRLYKLVQQLIDYHDAVRAAARSANGSWSISWPQLAAQQVQQRGEAAGQEAGQGHPRCREPDRRDTWQVRGIARQDRGGGTGSAPDGTGPPACGHRSRRAGGDGPPARRGSREPGSLAQFPAALQAGHPADLRADRRAFRS